MTDSALIEAAEEAVEEAAQEHETEQDPLGILNHYQVTDPENLPKAPAQRTEALRLRMAAEGKRDLYYLCAVILGYPDLVPHVHLSMCRFSDRAKYNRRLKLMPRTHLKTTIWTIAESIQDVLKAPNIRLLLVADTGMNACRFMEEIQQHFMMNEMFRWVYAEFIPKNFNVIRWNKNEMVVANRTIVAREPTIDAIGAMAGIESRHYDKIKADDLVTEKCIRSDVEMDKLIDWAGGLESLLVYVEDCIDWVGSRKKKGDLYESILKQYGEGSLAVDIGPYATMQGDIAVFTRQVIENGKQIWPERVTMKFLNRLRRVYPERYHAQYANSPKGSGLNYFQKEWLRYARWSPDYVPGPKGEILCIHDGKLLHKTRPEQNEIIVLFDPAKAEKQRSSYQAILVIMKGSHPFRIVLESHIGHFLPDEAVEKLLDIHQRWNPSFFSIEHRGYQGSIKYWLDEKCERENKPFLPILEWPAEGDPQAQWAKEEWIRGLQPIIRTNLLWVMEDQHELIDEIDFYPNVRYDDGVDALSQGLTYWPFSMDDDEVNEGKLRELNMLEKMAYGTILTQELAVEQPEWDEQEFLSMFDATGYNMRNS